MPHRSIVSGIYRHYKGKDYHVKGVAVLSGTEDSEKEEYVVIYEPMYDNRRLTYRPLDEFCEEVDVPECKYKGPRFKFVREL